MSEAGKALIKVGCSNCGSKYSLPRDRLKGRVLKIRCKSCDTIFEVRDKSPQSISARGQRRWFAVINRERTGPMTAQQVRDRFSRGEITLRTYVWRQGMAKWERLHRVPELGEVSEAPKEARASIEERRPAKERADTLRLVRLGSSKDEGAEEGGVKWAQAATRTADLSGMAQLSELQRQQDGLARAEEDPDEDADAPTQVRRVGSPKGGGSRPLYGAEEETTRRSAVYVDPETGEAREKDVYGEAPEEAKTRRAFVSGLDRGDTDAGDYREDAATVDQLASTGERVLGELADFAENLKGISETPTSDGASGGDGPDTLETDRPAGGVGTGPEIAVDPPARPGQAGQRLARERGQNSVLFSLDHLKADAKESFARKPTTEPKRRVERRATARHELSPVAEELFVPAAEAKTSWGGGLRFLVGVLVGGVFIFGALFAANPLGMKRLLGLGKDDPAAGVVAAGDEVPTGSKDATVLAAVTRPVDATAGRAPDTGGADAGGAGAGRALDAGRAGAGRAPDGGGTPKLTVPKLPAKDQAQPPKRARIKTPKKKVRRPRRSRKPRTRPKGPTKATLKRGEEAAKKRSTPAAKSKAADTLDANPYEPSDKAPAKGADKAPAKGADKAPTKGADKAPAGKDPGKPATLPEKLTRGEVKAGLDKARAAIKACASDGGLLTIEVTISGKTGRAVGARVLGALVEDEVKSCVARVVKQRARFPKFSQARMTAKVPLVLR